MNCKIRDRIVTILLIVGFLILGVDSYLKATAGIKAQIEFKEQAYAQGNFEYHRSKDPQDKDSNALYWYLQTLDLK